MTTTSNYWGYKIIIRKKETRKRDTATHCNTNKTVIKELLLYLKSINPLGVPNWILIICVTKRNYDVSKKIPKTVQSFLL